MRNRITTKELIKQRFSKEKAEEIFSDAENEINKIKWGGSREGSGRKAKPKGEVLQFTKRLTQKEVNFIDYARSHHLNYDELMQG